MNGANTRSILVRTSVPAVDTVSWRSTDGFFFKKMIEIEIEIEIASRVHLLKQSNFVGERGLRRVEVLVRVWRKGKRDGGGIRANM